MFFVVILASGGRVATSREMVGCPSVCVRSCFASVGSFGDLKSAPVDVFVSALRDRPLAKSLRSRERVGVCARFSVCTALHISLDISPCPTSCDLAHMSSALV